jgi:hypothetical protein
MAAQQLRQPQEPRAGIVGPARLGRGRQVGALDRPLDA